MDILSIIFRKLAIWTVVLTIGLVIFLPLNHFYPETIRVDNFYVWYMVGSGFSTILLIAKEISEET